MYKRETWLIYKRDTCLVYRRERWLTHKRDAWLVHERETWLVYKRETWRICKREIWLMLERETLLVYMRETWLVYKRETWLVYKRETWLLYMADFWSRVLLKSFSLLAVHVPLPCLITGRVQGRPLVWGAFQIDLLLATAVSLLGRVVLLCKARGDRVHGQLVILCRVLFFQTLNPCDVLDSRTVSVFWRCFLFLSAGNLFGWVESSPNCICKQVGCFLLFSRRTARPILWKWLSFNYSAFAPSAFMRLGLLSRMPTKSKQKAEELRFCIWGAVYCLLFSFLFSFVRASRGGLGRTEAQVVGNTIRVQRGSLFVSAYVL